MRFSAPVRSMSRRGAMSVEGILDRLQHDAGLARAVGRAGQAYVRRCYSWEAVLGRLDAALADAGVPAS